MNTTAVLLLKWLKERFRETKDLPAIKEKARYFWDHYGEYAIKKALKDQACTSVSKFVSLCKHYNDKR